MSNLENKLKKIVNKFNNIDRNLAYEDIKKLSTKYHKNMTELVTLPNCRHNIVIKPLLSEV